MGKKITESWATQDTLWGLSKKQGFDICRKNGFPGTDKWPKEHPIWDCNVDKYPTPREAWDNDIKLMKAVDNLYWVCHRNLYNDVGWDMLNRHKREFDSLDSEGISKRVLNRFTIAKIAPKVTALMSSSMLKILDEAKIDISNGIYSPMSGFGGIPEGCKRWFDEHGMDTTNKIEAYDINPNFCKWYGWNQRDVLAQVVHTDKVCIACPPFGEHTEKWNGTPNNMYYEFEEWACLIRKHVIAPNYILIGPEISNPKDRYASGAKASGLFVKKNGIQYYPEYSNFETREISKNE